MNSFLTCIDPSWVRCGNALQNINLDEFCTVAQIKLRTNIGLVVFLAFVISFVIIADGIANYIKIKNKDKKK